MTRHIADSGVETALAMLTRIVAEYPGMPDAAGWSELFEEAVDTWDDMTAVALGHAYIARCLLEVLARGYERPAADILQEQALAIAELLASQDTD